MTAESTSDKQLDLNDNTSLENFAETSVRSQTVSAGTEAFSSCEVNRKKCNLKTILHWKQLDPVNLVLNPTTPGEWDDWGVYYCSSRFGRHIKFNSKYFALVSIIIFGQSNFFHLIHLMHNNGGVVFLLVTLLVYMFIGYPTYLLETLMGQYSGRKPLQMIRYLLPIFSGLGVSMFIRTLFQAVVLLGRSGICLFHMWDLLFCNGATSSLLKRSIEQERDHHKFKVFHGLAHPLFSPSRNDTDFNAVTWFVFFLGFGVFVTFLKLPDICGAIKIVARLLLPALSVYSIILLVRVFQVWYDSDFGLVEANSRIFLPLQLTFKPNWVMLLEVDVWVKATVYVMNTLALGTLVHSYLGSKNFFHYRCTRDGVFLILLTVTWNVVGVIGVLVWLGYVTVSEQEIRNSLSRIDGNFGMFVVYILKHVQAELTSQIESDILFYCLILYLIIFITSIISSVVYIYILVDCTFPESGHCMTKLCTHVWMLLWIALIIFPLTFARNGLRHITFFSYYGAYSGLGLFNIFLFSVAVNYSQGIARFLYDFYNIIHLKGHEIRTYQYCVPRVVAFLFTLILLFALVKEIMGIDRPSEGDTNWDDILTLTFGIIIALLPIAAWLIGIVLYLIVEKRKGEVIFQPHRDFYKNKFHTKICFKDFENFTMDDATL